MCWDDVLHLDSQKSIQFNKYNSGEFDQVMEPFQFDGSSDGVD